MDETAANGVAYFDELQQENLVRWDIGKQQGFQTICSAATKQAIAGHVKYADSILSGESAEVDYETLTQAVEPPVKKQRPNPQPSRSQQSKASKQRKKRTATGTTKE